MDLEVTRTSARRTVGASRPSRLTVQEDSASRGSAERIFVAEGANDPAAVVDDGNGGRPVVSHQSQGLFDLVVLVDEERARAHHFGNARYGDWNPDEPSKVVMAEVADELIRFVDHRQETPRRSADDSSGLVEGEVVRDSHL